MDWGGGEQIRTVRLGEMSFETFTSIWSYVKKGNKNGQKSKMFTILWTTLVESFRRSMHEFCGVNLLCTCIGDVV